MIIFDTFTKVIKLDESIILDCNTVSNDNSLQAAIHPGTFNIHKAEVMSITP